MTSSRTSPLARAVVVLPLLAVAAAGLTACGSDAADGARSTVAAAVTTVAGDAATPPGVQRVSPAEGQQILQDQAGAITLIDVRTPEEFVAGHLDGATNLDIEGGQFSAEIAALPKGAAYMVYCHSGRRSALAAQAMSDAGFTNVYDLGGIADWEAAGLPVVTG